MKLIKCYFRKPSPFKNVSERPFMPPANGKLHSTPGDWYGTFEGKMDAFSTKMKARAPFKHEGPNALTNPGKKGGYGYVNICLNPYPDHRYDLESYLLFALIFCAYMKVVQINFEASQKKTLIVLIKCR